MSMHFPSRQDIRLERSPLTEVVCQLRFSPVLSIDRRPPSDFQERVRRRFPRYESSQAISIMVPPVSSGQSPNAEPDARLHRFLTKDQRSAITLTVDSIALSTSAYGVWEHFLSDLSLAFDALQAVYNLQFFTRIGLRYVNQLTCKGTGTDSVEELGPVCKVRATPGSWRSSPSPGRWCPASRSAWRHAASV
jgi:uncharacterized protein (TIGR04255 family)